MLLNRLLTRLWRRHERTRFASLGVVLTLVVGFAAGGTLATLIDRLYVRPLALRDADRVVMLWQDSLPASAVMQRGIATPEDVATWRRAGVFEGLAVVQVAPKALQSRAIIAIDGLAEPLAVALATPDLFALVGVPAAAGRVEGGRGGFAGDGAVISHRLWIRALGGRTDAVGSELAVGDRRVRVAGVLPAEATILPAHPAIDVWLPLPWTEAEGGGRELKYHVLARLPAGMTFSALRASLDVLERRAADVVPNPRPRQIVAEPLRDYLLGPLARARGLCWVAAALLLSVTLLNAASLLTVHVTARAGELALRRMLGASASRVFGELLVDATLITVGSAAVGLAVAAWLVVPALHATVPAAFDAIQRATVDARIAAAALASAAVLAAIVTVLASHGVLLREVRLPTVEDRRIAVRGNRRIQQWLLGAQLAAVLGLVVVGSLLGTAVQRLAATDLGFAGRELVTASVRLPWWKYAASADRARFAAEWADAVRALPDVEQAAVTSALPFIGVDWTIGAVTRVHGAPATRGTGVQLRQVDGAFFSTLGIRQLSGRGFDTRDTATSPRVAVVSRALARQLFGHEQVLDELVIADDDAAPARIVGVVDDVRYAGTAQPPRPAIYVPRAQNATELVCLLVRARGGSGDGTLFRRIRAAAAAIDPVVPVGGGVTVGAIVDESTADRRFYARGMRLLAPAAIGLCLLGLAGHVLQAAASRRHELGIRAALGATPRQVAGHVAAISLGPMLIGAGLGVPLAWWAARAVSGLLYDLPITDAATWLTAAAVVAGAPLLVGLAAGLSAAHRNLLDTLAPR